MSVISPKIQMHLACQLDIELNPNFVLYLYCASGDPDRLDAKVRQLEQ